MVETVGLGVRLLTRPRSSPQITSHKLGPLSSWVVLRAYASPLTKNATREQTQSCIIGITYLDSDIQYLGNGPCPQNGHPNTRASCRLT